MWTCGGEMEIVPCSKVGHVYKQRNVYSYPRGNRRTTTCNTRRVADAWLDQFAQIYYLTLNSEQRGYECGDVAQVRQRREQLGCKPFKWYLENIYPELQVNLATFDREVGGGILRVLLMLCRCLWNLRLPLERSTSENRRGSSSAWTAWVRGGGKINIY